VITALQAKRNRPYRHTLVFVLLLSWISLILSATCSMPMPSVLTAMPEHMPGCSDSGVAGYSHHQDHTAKAMQNCSFKPCLDSQTHSFPDFNRLAKPDLPVFILSLIWTSWYLFLSYPPTKIPPHKADPPLGRRILLIYQFCTLLN
jgi:hypothetical protein